MPTLEAELIGETLWITGNVDRSMEKDLTTALEKFVREGRIDHAIVDMSNVNYFASSAAKVLIGVAQDIEAKGNKLKVRSSMPVVQTLNLLGARTWLEIEPCQKPNAKPAGAPAAKEKTSATSIAPVSRTSSTGIQPATAQAKGGTGTYTPTVHLKPAAPEPPKTPTGNTTQVLKAHASGVRQAISGSEKAEEAVSTAADRAGALLIEDEMELDEDYGVLRELVVMATYTFRFANGTDLTGKVLDHISGPWILIDTRGAKRMVNVGTVSSIDIL
ncbi:MAG: anti-sigma factor antagonist [Planctomycetota bacterium]|nr:anti-sigma factor antagonist [Planctomycetota bacterium]